MFSQSLRNERTPGGQCRPFLSPAGLLHPLCSAPPIPSDAGFLRAVRPVHILQFVCSVASGQLAVHPTSSRPVRYQAAGVGKLRSAAWASSRLSHAWQRGGHCWRPLAFAAHGPALLACLYLPAWRMACNRSDEAFSSMCSGSHKAGCYMRGESASNMSSGAAATLEINWKASRHPGRCDA